MCHASAEIDHFRFNRFQADLHIFFLIDRVSVKFIAGDQPYILNINTNRAGCLAPSAHHAVEVFGRFYLVVPYSSDLVGRLHIFNSSGKGQLASVNANTATGTGPDFHVGNGCMFLSFLKSEMP